MTGTTEAASAAAASAGPAADRRRRASVVFPVIVVAVIALVVGMSLAFTRDDGASTPEAALTALLDAIESGDGAGVLAALPPSERRALVDGLPALTVHLRALGLVDGGGPSAPGLPSITTDGLVVSTTELGRNATAVDLISGELTASFGPGGGGPLTAAGRVLLADPDLAPSEELVTITRDLAQEPVRLIAVRDGGGWHISLAYSLLDALVVTDDATPAPELGDGPLAFGSTTPEEAVTDLFRAYADANVERLITVLDPDEARSLYDFAPTLLPGTTPLVGDLQASGAYDVQLNSIETTVEGDGSTRRVRVTGLDLDIRDQVAKMHLVLADECLVADYRIDDDDEPFARYEVCADEWDAPNAMARPLDNPVGNAAVFGGGAELPSFTVIERNGRWFISPFRSLLDSTSDTLDALEPADQQAFLERLVRSARAGAGDGLIGTPVPPELTPDERATTLIARCDALVPDESPTAADPASISRDCLDRLVRTGSIAWEAIPADRRVGLAPPPA